mgnify:CR=1 FL=1
MKKKKIGYVSDKKAIPRNGKGKENKMKNFNELTVKLLGEELENYEGENITACELAWTLTQGYNVDGTITYNTQESINLIFKYWWDIADIYNEYLGQLGQCEINIFERPEAFLTLMFIENAEILMSNCEIIESNWNENIELNRENIDTIKKQLESGVN